MAMVGLMLACATPAQAGWPAIGGGPAANTSSVEPADQATASVGDVPWVVWVERPAGPSSPRQIQAARWDGTTWVTTGPVNADLAHDAATPSIGAADGTPYVSWVETVDGAHRVRVARWNGNAWEPVGGAIDDGDGIEPSIAVLPASTSGPDYSTLVAFKELGAGGSDDLVVKRWTGSAWVEYGGVVTTGAGIDAPTLVYNVGRLAVGWTQQGAAHVAWFGGEAGWQMSAPLPTEGPVSALTIAPYERDIMVAWSERAEPGQQRLRVVSTQSSYGPRSLASAAVASSLGWVNFGDVVATSNDLGESTLSLAELRGRPAVAWTTDRQAHLFEYDGGWSEIPGSWATDQSLESRQLSLVESAWGTGPGLVSWNRPASAANSAAGEVVVARYAVDGATSHMSFTAGTYVVQERGVASVTVRRTGSTGEAVTVWVYAQTGDPDGASSPEDFTDLSEHLTFAPGETEKTISIPIVDDDLHEPNEKISLGLWSSSGDSIIDPHEPATLTILDDDAMETTIKSGPAGVSNAVRPSFSFAGNGPSTTFACWIDGAAPAPCTSPFVPETLAQGEHTFHVRAFSGGDPDLTPAARTFTVDSVEPTASLELRREARPGGTLPVAVTVQAAATDPAPSSGAAVRCVIDPPAQPVDARDVESDCGTTVTTGGTHVAYAVAIDQAGNRSALVSSRFAVAETPKTTITSHPTAVSSAVAEFAFTADLADSTFECRFDDAPFAPCVSPVRRDLALGAHGFAVRATSPDGVTDPTPETTEFSLRKAATSGACTVGVGWDSTRACKPFGTTGLAPVCPERALCTLTVTAQPEDGDDASSVGKAIAVVTSPTTVPSSVSKRCKGRRRGPVTGPRCRAAVAVSTIDAAERLTAQCGGAGAGVGRAADTERGTDRARRLRCTATFTVEPVKPLQMIARGHEVVVALASAGTLQISEAAGAKPAALTGPSTATSTSAGASRVALNLSAAAWRTLKTKGALILHLAVRFSANGGATTTAMQTVTLTPQP